MADFKKGDRVLVEATTCLGSDGFGSLRYVSAKGHEPMASGFGIECYVVHAHPGVPVAALMRECELAETMLKNGGKGSTEMAEEHRYLRDAREAANKPQLSMGRLEKLIEPALEARIGDRVFLYLKGSDSALGGHLTRPVNWMGNVLAIYTEGIAAPEEESRALVEQIAAVFVLRMEDD